MVLIQGSPLRFEPFAGGRNGFAIGALGSFRLRLVILHSAVPLWALRGLQGSEAPGLMGVRFVIRFVRFTGGPPRHWYRVPHIIEVPLSPRTGFNRRDPRSRAL